MIDSQFKSMEFKDNSANKSLTFVPNVTIDLMDFQLNQTAF